jgi:protein TonB
MRTVINYAAHFALVSTHILPASHAVRNSAEGISLTALIGMAAIHGAALLGLARFAPSRPPGLTPPAVSMQVEMISSSPAATTHTPATMTPSPSIKRETLPRVRRSAAKPSAPNAKASDIIATPGGPAATENPTATAADDPPAATQSTTASAPAPTETTQARFDADYLKNPAPAYPAMSRRLREEGRVVLRVFVSVEGRPQQIELKTSSGFARLDQAAEDAVRRWKFVPARHGDKAFATWVAVPIVFNLHS